MAIEAMDRALRGEGSPAPIWEGEDGVIAWLLSGKEHVYRVPLPEQGEPKLGILETYTKEHSAEYQSQAPIDLARSMKPKVDAAGGTGEIAEIVLHTSHHTHYVIGTGAQDPQKMDPQASRETLDHSIMYIFAVALQDGVWHHEHSYSRKRATRPETVELWHKIRTLEDPEWTRRYHSDDPQEKAFGARAVITMNSGIVIEEELGVADAHPLGKRPFERHNYIEKFRTLAAKIVPEQEQERFLQAVQKLPDLEDLSELNIEVDVSAEAETRPGLL